MGLSKQLYNRIHGDLPLREKDLRLVEMQIKIANDEKIYTCYRFANMPLPSQFDGSDHEQVCAKFGCKNILTMPEQLAGSLCTGCMNTKRHDITSIIFKQ